MTISFTSKLFGERQKPRRKELHQGQHKNIYEGTCEDSLVLFFKDAVFVKKEVVEINGIGAINQRISETLFTQLSKVGIRNHFIKSLNMREQLVQAAEVIPVSVRVYTEVTGELAQRYNLEKETSLQKPIIEYRTISEQRELLSKDHLDAFDIAEESEIFEIESLARRTTDVLFGFMAAKGLILQACDLQFGRIYTDDPFADPEIILVNELSPRTLHTKEALSENNLSLSEKEDISDIGQIYQLFAERFFLNPMN